MSVVARSELTGIRLKKKNGDWQVNPELRGRMIADADRRHTNLTDLATEILSTKYNVPYVRNMRRSSPAAGSDDQMNFRFSDELKRAIIIGAAPTSLTDAIRQALCEHYGLPMP